MVKNKPGVVIDNLAKLQLKEAYEFIKLDSPKSAEKVRSKILTSIRKLSDHPDKYPLDKFRLNNDGSYRAFEIYSYRVSYNVSLQRITITSIRHTKREPRLH